MCLCTVDDVGQQFALKAFVDDNVNNIRLLQIGRDVDDESIAEHDQSRSVFGDGPRHVGYRVMSKQFLSRFNTIPNEDLFNLNSSSKIPLVQSSCLSAWRAFCCLGL